MVPAGGGEGRLVAHVGDIGPGETGGVLGHELHGEVFSQLDVPQVHLKDFLAFLEFWQFHMDLAVETAGTHQGLVQNIRAVGGGQDYYTTVGAKAVHFRKKLIQRVFALVIGRKASVLGTGAAHGVNLVDKDNARRLFLGLAEQIPHTGCSHAYEHFHEVRSRNGEERNVGLPCHGLGQQGFTGARRAHQQRSLRDFSAQGGVLLGVLEEVHNLHHLFLGAIQAGHVLEGDLGLILVRLPRIGLAHVERVHATGTRTAAHSTVHAAEHPHPKQDEDEERKHHLENIAPDMVFILDDYLELFYGRKLRIQCAKGGLRIKF